MKRSLSGKPSIIKNGLDGRFVGFSLGWDFTAEHEWGIQELMNICGIETEATSHSFEDYKINIAPEFDAFLFEVEAESGKASFAVDDNIVVLDLKASDSVITRFDSEILLSEIKELSGDNILTAWDRGGFQIIVAEERVDDLRSLVEEFRNSNAAIFLAKGDGNPYGNASLHVVIYDRFLEYTENLTKALNPEEK